jgi:transposase-like protein
MNTYGMSLMGRRRRRRHRTEFKAAMIQERMRPGVPIAAVALTHGLNSNMLPKWMIDTENALSPGPKTAPVQPTAQNTSAPSPLAGVQETLTAGA